MTYKFIDVCKFLFCLCIVAIHTHALADLPHWLASFTNQSIFRLAVPFFFVASGYFFGKKLAEKTDSEKNRILKNYIKRLFQPLCIFGLINILLTSYQMQNLGWNYSSIFINIIRHIIFYPWGALWFVQACIIGMTLLYPFIIRRKTKTALMVGIMLYTFALLCNNYFFIVKNTLWEGIIQQYISYCYSARNGLFVGFIFLAIGVFLSENSNFLNKIKEKKILFGAFVFYVFEILILAGTPSLDDSSLYISQLFITPIIFSTALNTNTSLSSDKSKILRSLSVGIYFLHKPIISILNILHINFALHVINFVITAAICTIICALVYRKNCFLKKILS